MVRDRHDNGRQARTLRETEDLYNEFVLRFPGHIYVQSHLTAMCRPPQRLVVILLPLESEIGIVGIAAVL